MSVSNNQKVRVVITGVGLTAPNANNLKEFRDALLTQKSGITQMEVRYMGKVAVGKCSFDEHLYQKKKCADGEQGQGRFQFIVPMRH